MSEHQPTTGQTGTLLASGDVVAGLDSVELVEIQRVVPFGGKTLVEGIEVQSRRLVQRLLATDELSALEKVHGRQRSFDGDPHCFLLGAEAERIRIAHQFDPHLVEESDWVGHGKEVDPPPDTGGRRK